MTLRIMIYARYSSDLQNPSSIDDQVSLCRKLAEKQFPGACLVATFSDAAMSGATMHRPGIRALLESAKAGQADMVMAESLDRLSRSMKDIASIYEELAYYGVSIFTSQEGSVTELHVGLMGTMSALYLRDMKAKVKRGQSAKIAAGLSPSFCAYGYRVVYGAVDSAGRVINGVRAVDDATADVVRRIYQEYADGKNLPEIVAGLNQDGIPSPAGGLWKRNSLMGGVKKQEGILRNEIYVGKLIYHRSHVIRDPITNRKKFVYHPEAEWTKVDVPHLRIVGDDLWRAARARDVQRTLNRLAKTVKSKPVPATYTRRNQHALTGLVKCGWCGGLKSLGKYGRYVCSVNRYAHKCRNGRGAKETNILRQVMHDIHARISTGSDFRPAILCAHEAQIATLAVLDEKERKLKERCNRLLQALEHGILEEHVTKRILELQTQLAEVRQQRAVITMTADFPEEGVIRKKLATSVDEIASSGQEAVIHEMFKTLIGQIVLTPIEGQRNGETIAITLREQGWPDFWRLIAK